MRVLIADDDPLFPQELAELLRSEGHRATPVSSADEAVAVLERDWHDVLLTDLRMPRKSGTVLLDEVSRRWPGVRSIILTGQPSDEAIASSLRHGAFNFIGKPFQLAELAWALDVVQEDIAEGQRAAPRWDPSSAPASIPGLLDGPVRLWGPPLAGVSRTDSAPLGEPGSPVPGNGGPVSGTTPRLLHLGDGSSMPIPVEGYVRRAAEIIAQTAGTTPIVVVAERRMFSTPHLIALWAILDRRPVPRGLGAAQGPKRREILRQLSGRQLELELVRREVPLPGHPGRARLYLEHLVTAGLVQLREGRYGLSRSGREVVELLAAFDAAKGDLPDGRYLFSTDPATSDEHAGTDGGSER